MATALAACQGDELDESGTSWTFEQAVEAPRAAGNADTMLDVLLAKNPTPQNLKKIDPLGQFALRVERDEVIADLFVETDRDHLKGVVRSLVNLGGTVRTITPSGIITASLPVSQINGATSAEGVGRVELARRVKKFNDVSHTLAGMNIPNAGTSNAPSGAGVIVGVIDSGLDYKHPDFRDADGNSRVLALWDQSDHADFRPAGGFGYGTTYSQAELNDCLADIGYCQQVDSDGHGTHVAGTAAGNGNASGGKYAGAAYEAEILFVKFDFEGDRNSDAAIVDGVNWIFQQAGDRPVVINMSLGGTYGPHDSSTLEERGLDDLIGPGKLVVAAAGNEARTPNGPNADLWGQPLHGSGNFALDTCTDPILVNVPAQSVGGYIFFDIWYSGSETNRVRIKTPSGRYYPSDFKRFNRTTWTTGSNIGAYDTSEGYLLVANGGDQLGWNTDNGDHELYVEISDNGTPIAAGTWEICIWGTSVGAAGGEFHGWHGNTSDLNLASITYGGRPTDNSMTVGAPASASEVIAVGAYTTRMGWEALDLATNTASCMTYNYGYLSYYDPYYVDTNDNSAFDHDFGSDCWYDPALGDSAEPFNVVAFFSSRGPLRNGAQVPDIAAPGVGIISALSSTVLAQNYADANAYLRRSNRIVSEQYSVLQGTSMASPNATGAVALLLQANPDLDAQSLRDALATTARPDAYTGTVPNHDYGAGKLDVTAALTYVNPGCSLDAECDDGDPCTTDACVDSACVSTAGNDGATCDDGNDCTEADVCLAGSFAGSAVAEETSCGSGDACSNQVCILGTCETVAANEGQPCADDGNFCTQSVCRSAQCMTEPANEGELCGDLLECTEDVCKAGSCMTTPLAEAPANCQCAPIGQSCDSDSDCCSNSCKGKPGAKTCK